MRRLPLSLVRVGPLFLVACAPPEVDGLDSGAAPFEDPTGAGPYDVARTDVALDLDIERGGLPSTLPASLYVPDRGGEALPVVLFHHGFATSPTAYHATLTHLASHGFVVLAPTFDSGFTNTRTHAGLAEDAAAIFTWLQQNALPTDASLALEAFGQFGHSRGGKAALLTAATDTRVGGTFTVDPVDAGPPFGSFDAADFPSVAPELAPAIAGAVAQLGAGRGPEGAVPCAPSGENYAAYWDAYAPGARQIVAERAGHTDVLDACADGTGGTTCTLCPPGDDPAATAALARGAAVAFFAQALEGDTTYDGWWPSVVADGVRYETK
ncbi:MAG: hypothetical protein RLZZ383_2568 [Pseudomonadota bacterium]|jgi:chlorophyllase